MKKIVLILLCAAMILPGCGPMSKTGQGTLIGSGAGAAIGAGIGALIGNGKGAAIGAAIGTAVGAGTGAVIGSGAGAAIGAGIGALIGNGKGAAIGAAIGTAVGAGTGAVIGKKMDKKAEELAALQNATVETIKDANGLDAIKVTFESGILFPTNGTTLSADSKKALADFAAKMSDLVDTDITIWGHTDNTGTAAVNERISKQRAEAVSTYLGSCGIAKSRMTAEGKSFNLPVADNATAEGRAQNRRVEVYITANEDMIKAAAEGTLK